MDLRGVHPFEYFNRWFAEPLTTSDPTVLGVMTALNAHPLAAERATHHFVIRPEHYRDEPGRFRLLGESEDVFYYFVREGDEREVDPPVYFESCLDLVADHSVEPDDVLAGNCALACERFTDFLWYLLGCHVCLRESPSALFSPGVVGMTYRNRYPELAEALFNPLTGKFFAADTCLFSGSAIICQGWGAAFQNERARTAFIKLLSPADVVYWESRHDWDI